VTTETSVVTETEGVCGGYPCIKNTRIPVRALVLAFRQLDDFEQTVAAFPQMTRYEVRSALDWYHQASMAG
jgi:uncharacterized protein (DUF433 family)